MDGLLDISQLWRNKSLAVRQSWVVFSYKVTDDSKTSEIGPPTHTYSRILSSTKKQKNNSFFFIQNYLFLFYTQKKRKNSVQSCFCMQTSGILYMQFRQRGITATKFIRIHSGIPGVKSDGWIRGPNETGLRSVEVLRILCELGLFSHSLLTLIC